MTVLVGPNASGKSNLLDVLGLLKDELGFDLEAAVPLRRGFGVSQTGFLLSTAMRQALNPTEATSWRGNLPL